MNILEFIGELEALPPQVRQFAREKHRLAAEFAAENLASSFPLDVNGTRIPDQALDGYFAQKILTDPSISKEQFADYAFMASTIFASHQAAMRTGFVDRPLFGEHAFYLTRTIKPCWPRLLNILDTIPMVLSWWPKGSETHAQAVNVLKMVQVMEGRKTKSPYIQQVMQSFSCGMGGHAPEEVPISIVKSASDLIRGKIGLLVMSDLLEVGDYVAAFRCLKPRFSDLVTVMIYDKRPVVDLCLTALSSMNGWRGIALKHLAYQHELKHDDYALLALQANFFDCSNEIT